MHRFELKPEDRAAGTDAVVALADTLREIGHTLERAEALRDLAEQARPDRAAALAVQAWGHIADAHQLVDQARGLTEALGRRVRTAEGLATLRPVAYADEREVRSW